jgi:ATP-dependent exoDNAse (exonuclease V) beta subunit
LVKKNATAAALADHLRRAGIPALAESDLHVATDNPLGAALLALAQAAAHPGDSLAREHVRMTPLGDALQEQGITTAEALTTRVLTQIHAGGFERAFEYWVEQLEPRLAPDDAFSRQRAKEFVAAAGLFDASGSRDLDEFIAFMERYTVRAPDSAAVVRIMTVHKSKGLGFDLVILPDLQGNRIDEPRGGLAVWKSRDRAVQWVLDLPPRLYCEQDDVLAAFVRAAEADACYENLSLLYVAMTRAKRAMYVITEPAGKSKSRNFPRLLADTLGDETVQVQVGGTTFPGAWSTGDANWHAGSVAAEPTTTAPRMTLALVPSATNPVSRFVGLRPSAGREMPVPAAGLFTLQVRAAEIGTAVHAMLAQIEWATADDASAWSGQWEQAGYSETWVESATRCVAASVLAHVWRRPSAKADVWRERAFEIVLDGAWITGVFDRVVIERESNGRARAVVVYDFKTDAVASIDEAAERAARYAEQLGTYRRVAAVLAGVPGHCVRSEVVFTSLPATVPLP